MQLLVLSSGLIKERCCEEAVLPVSTHRSESLLRLVMAAVYIMQARKTTRQDPSVQLVDCVLQIDRSPVRGVETIAHLVHQADHTNLPSRRNTVVPLTARKTALERGQNLVCKLIKHVVADAVQFQGLS